MKNTFLSVGALLIIFSCGDVSKSSGLSEKELISGFEGVRSKFNIVFENSKDCNQEKLKSLNDSLAYYNDSLVFYVDAMLAEYSNSPDLPELLCRAGRSSLDAKNSVKALEYLNYVVDSFPNHTIVPQSMYFIGLTKEVLLKDVLAAKESYKKLYRAYPNSVWGKRAKDSSKLISKPLVPQNVEQENDSLNPE
ncbi:MAG: hypothetical protein CMP67_01320 [Flavobacteriales bacterium]|nr:hypothetical protein [Flavobacteriales bacterium]|tara:strand:+ start:5723 stop:6301 length:579 start_codon:yes stop_codon:yes gene_type:complete